MTAARITVGGVRGLLFYQQLLKLCHGFHLKCSTVCHGGKTPLLEQNFGCVAALGWQLGLLVVGGSWETLIAVHRWCVLTICPSSVSSPDAQQQTNTGILFSAPPPKSLLKRKTKPCVVVEQLKLLCL